jgi:putative phosphoesterase
MILHAGDILNPALLHMLPAPVTAVAGNSDNLALNLPSRLILPLAGYNVGLIHGFGLPLGLNRRVRQQFAQVDAIIFGHSHVPEITVLDEAYMFNPGSPTRSRGGGATFGILQIDDKIQGEIIKVE